MNASYSKNTIKPIFFGKSSKELYGCYHLPKKSPVRNCGIVLCYPIGQEYIMSHRSFYNLAVQLSFQGFHVFRFDYWGCGDSAGEFEQGTLHQWVSDIQTASNELTRRSGVSRISLLGLRMGATLAMMAAQQNNDFDSLILWEPILDGQRYVKELLEMQKLYSKHKKGKKKWASGMDEEILGFPLTKELRQSLEKIKAEKIVLPVGRNILTLCNDREDNCRENLSRLLAVKPDLEWQSIRDHCVWREELYKRLIPAETIKYLIQWISRAY